MMPPIPLRAHHGMCLHYFIGKGYSGAFIANMLHFQRLLSEENPPVQLTTATDALCAHCPHNAGGSCDFSSKVAAYDTAVLERCGFSEGDVMTYQAFSNAVEKVILDANLRSKICGDCQWSAYCTPGASPPLS